MIVVKDILEGYGGIDWLRNAEACCLRASGRVLHLEFLGLGPTTQNAVRLVRINHFGAVDQEIHLEWCGAVWVPYYLRDDLTGVELFLYRFVGAQEPLLLDLEVGLQLIQAAAILDFNLLADGFVQAAEESLYYPLFSVTGGAA